MSRPAAQRAWTLIQKSLQQGRVSATLRRAVLATERADGSDQASHNGKRRLRGDGKKRLASLGGAALMAGVVTTGMAAHAMAEAAPKSGERNKTVHSYSVLTPLWL
jgi:hypothetical protein